MREHDDVTPPQHAGAPGPDAPVLPHVPAPAAAAPAPGGGAAPPPRAPIPRTAQLSWSAFLAALAVTLGVFFLLNPFWRPLDMAAVDANIAWSYAPIPLLVLLLLRVEHKLAFWPWALETLRLTFVKFAITYLVANGWWAFAGAPGVPAGAGQARPPPPVDPARATAAVAVGETVGVGETARGAARKAGEATGGGAVARPAAGDALPRGRVTGRVVDAAGAPRADVLVALARPPRDLPAASPEPQLVLRHGGAGFEPLRLVVPARRALAVHAAEGELHTVRAVDAHGRPLFNLPLLPGAEQPLAFDRAHGLLRLDCMVHGRGEHAAELFVASHPFVVLTGGDGHFALDGVPAGDIELTAIAWNDVREGGEPVRQAVDLPPQGSADVTLVLR